ncbi:bifunctional 2-C-methyl-D-erythritol 4-phosphate cytidylyltransferase/2-C-methyl-D-erythritol 2,4-cyclodiphosphate synthase [Zymomonas mobilis]|uniref:Bifunctional enzyme IspD/IspF n=1 Tax=Zymomonas mobilis subsp. mobilis (strain ATCC 10988 / DSM 424 / LMG 404 / NCIMB 8938 / NRRL B-806 / ZM1) TaxID=555217 RepID=A0A0H3G060_ZYMMA|nr:bifunctional 2-C-methyl-D-erythritol 4-phosphate cytidylyltransferase/2-C-methyl-D-erythritol 2,4-cyclodiphosphate synthase [Zymomonas mobilis]AEH62052.1 2-C-methyl-D-erythritol 4-phosphate cytidylyltransferase [Zymomonas mobilis subsp. mobilis ATCC 10988]TQL28353.1 2-C-methyl-D-erythritol 4-phosphate cytidylyltransferase /2-C-methyl-D-erythritol 2,4-cyclodiphosphate synthase [Zymomonas mobilis]TQL30289.1 2-C-methyl-D-erythritol 4-phosphate cytidylyltransferase /2-C-methyl-D-erythritol 2,4-cy
MMKRTDNIALIVAAGQGKRAGEGLPKQYRQIAGKAILAHAIDNLLAHPEIDTVQVVIADGHQALYQEAVGDRDLPQPVIGGVFRRDSVINGLKAAHDRGYKRVLIHDAARPFLPKTVIDRLLDALKSSKAAIPVLPVVDTLVNQEVEAVDRNLFHRVQTPQAFDLETVIAAHQAWTGSDEPTDDAQVVRAFGKKIALVTGDRLLEKLTYPADFSVAEAQMTEKMISVCGSGFDVHCFEAGDHIMLGGIKIPHDHGLAGHSDADVALHALTDALLGAIADGDIGTHFPPSDPQWKGANSTQFLEYAVALAKKAGAIIDHADVTVICEAPKVGPYRPAMRKHIAQILGLPEQRVSIKATTTEKLGFTGRKEGIAAQAVTSIRLPDILC